MGDFVSKEEVDKIRKHLDAYYEEGSWQVNDNRGEPVSKTYDASTFREVSTSYVRRLLRYIEVEEMRQSILSNKGA